MKTEEPETSEPKPEYGGKLHSFFFSSSISYLEIWKQNKTKQKT